MNLVDKALATINSDTEIIGEGCYRYVKAFQHRRRKYVVKYDIRIPDDNGSCESEALCWERYKDSSAGKILAPVITYGPMPNGFGHWLVMSQLQTISKVLRYKNDELALSQRTPVGQPLYFRGVKYLKEIIFPRVATQLTNPRWYMNRIACQEFGNDLHWENWAMDNRGNWFLIDYSEGGNLRRVA